MIFGLRSSVRCQLMFIETRSCKFLLQIPIFVKRRTLILELFIPVVLLN